MYDSNNTFENRKDKLEEEIKRTFAIIKLKSIYFIKTRTARNPAVVPQSRRTKMQNKHESHKAIIHERTAHFHTDYKNYTGGL